MKPHLWLLIALCAAVAGFFSGLGSASSRSRPERNAAARDKPEAPEEQEALRAQLRSEQKRVRELLAENKLLRETVADAAERERTDGDIAEGAAKPEDTGKPAYVIAGMEEALAQIDWARVGESASNLTPLLAKYAAALLAGEPPPPEVGEIQRWNGPLVTEALKAQQAGIKGTGVNGAFSHPAMTVNLVAAALRRSDTPLSEAQNAALEELGRRYSAAENERHEAYADDVPQLQRTLEEAALKARLSAELGKVLDAGQMDRLRPEGVRDYAMLDIVSEGVMLGPVARPVQFKDRADLEKRAAEQFGRSLGLDDSARPALAAAVRVWVQKFDDEFLAEKQKPLQRAERIRKAGEHQLELQRAILATVPLTDAQKKMLRDNPTIFVPYRQ